MTAALFSASSRKKQRISLESVTSLPAGNETVPSATGSPGAEEPAAMERTSAAGPTTGLESTEVAWPISGGEGTSVASAGTGSVEMGVGRGPSSRVGEETGSGLEDIRGTGGKETTAETTAVDSTPRTSQDILGDFAEDWLATLDKNEIKSISLLCYHFVHAFSLIETKAAEYAASMMKKSDRTARRWRSTLIDDGVLSELEQWRYQRSGVLWQNEEQNKKAVEYV